MNLIKELLTLQEAQLFELVQLPADASIEDLNKRLEACKRALSLCAKLPKDDRKKWLSQTFKNMNVIRAALKRAEKSTKKDVAVDKFSELQTKAKALAKESGVPWVFSLREDADGTPIHPRIRRYMNENDIHYPNVESLEDLKKAHAQQILNKGGWKTSDSEERGLGHALGIANLSNDEYEKIVHPDIAQDPKSWEFSAQDPAFSGCDTLYGPEIDGKQYVIVNTNDPTGNGQWECGVLDVNDHHQPIDDMYVWAEDRHDVEEWLDNNNLLHPTEDQFDEIGL